MTTSRLVAFAQLLRLPNTFTAWADIVLAAWAMGLIAERPGMFACLLLASTCLYWSGMVWNDFFDQRQDARERPHRPLPSGRIHPREARLLATALMLAGLLLAWLSDHLSPEGTWRALPIGLLLILAIFLYDGVLKRTWAGPVAMGACRFLNVLLGLAISGTLPPAWGVLLGLVIGSYITGLTWFARTEAVRSNQQTLTAAAMLSGASLLFALAVPALAQQARPELRPFALFPYLLAAYALYLAVPTLAAIERPVPVRVQAAVKRAILGLIVLDAILASALVGPWGLVLVGLLLPGLLATRWLYAT